MTPTTTLPPGPALAPSEQAKLWIERPLALLDECVRQYGDIFTLNLGAFGTIVILGHPNAVRAIFRAPADLFECRHFNESYRYVMGGHAIFLQDGPAHRRIRRIMVPLFDRENLLAYAPDIVAVTQGVIRHWSSGQSLALRPMMHEVSLGVLLKIVFGARAAAGAQILNWFRTQVWRDLRAWKPWTSLSRLHPPIRALISDELAQRRERGVPGGRLDLLDALLAARDEAGQPLGDEEIQDQILTLMITAGDAVATALSWSLYWMAKAPEAQTALRAELGRLGEEPDSLAVLGLPSLTAVCQEVLRLNTVLPTVSGRRLKAPMEILGYPMEAGVTLAPCEYLVHRRADLFPEPLAFRPERFLGRQYSPYEYFPFGGSHRACLGSSLAPMEMKLALATILPRWRLALTDSRPVEVVRYGTLLAPTHELRIEVAEVPR
jgi:cytochrome P450